MVQLAAAALASGGGGGAVAPPDLKRKNFFSIEAATGEGVAFFAVETSGEEA